MLKIIPSVKEKKILNGFLNSNSVFYDDLNCDDRVLKALKLLPFDKNGAKLTVEISGDSGEAYEISVRENDIGIKAEGPAGAFYAVQTLRQLFKNGKIPCIDIKDAPDFAIRGFYHDITRGRVPTVKKLKELIDKMAYFKLNHLQLYVEHAYEFKETEDIIGRTGCITADELKELDAYCKEQFIEFVPSLATFGHMYEILQQDKYRHLAIASDFEAVPNFWNSRTWHHTIDPLNPKSIEFVKSLINQYSSNFTSDFFNICGDETFDLHSKYDKTHDAGQLYVEFVNKIIEHLNTLGKTPMMWHDIVLKHPEFIEKLPEETVFLNYNYSYTIDVDSIIKLSELGRKQIVCPGTTAWSRFCEDVTESERNISLMAEIGHKYGAIGVLNTNWGDWGHPCSMELSAYGMVLGAEKSWHVTTKIDEDYYDAVNFLLYGSDCAVQLLKKISCMQHFITWNNMCSDYYKYRYNLDWYDYRPVIWKADYEEVKSRYLNLKHALESTKFENDNYRKHMLLAIEGIMVTIELYAKIKEFGFARVTNTKSFVEQYKTAWLNDNKPSELNYLLDIFTYIEEN